MHNTSLFKGELRSRYDFWFVLYGPRNVRFFWCDFVLHVLNFTNAKLYESLFIYLVSDVNARVLN